MSTNNFKLFAAAVAAHFTSMTAGGTELYRTPIAGDDLWAHYLAAFPQGSNPMFRVRTEHDGSYDRNFVRQLGNVVRINDDGSLTTLWGIQGLPFPYDVVAAELDQLVKGQAIAGLFRTKEPKFGYVQTLEKRENAAPFVWHHFHADIPKHLRTMSVGEACGAAENTVQVIQRGFDELAPEAVQTVLELIAQNTLYRGAEFESGLRYFQSRQQQYRELGALGQNRLVWRLRDNLELRIRNTVIGQLLQDLSEGMELEAAVKRYEKMVAPANYKRPTALITPRMIEDAVDTIRALDLESALQRRHATLRDVSIHDVRWADNRAQAHMKDGLTDLLMGAVKQVTPDADKATEIDMDAFIEGVVPKAVGIELFLDNKLRGNLISITAPVDPAAGRLFKWDNGFAWSYAGNIADSEMRRAVEAKGGRVDGVFRFTHQWNYGKRNASLMDLHVFLPGNTTVPSAYENSHGAGYGNSERVGWNHRKHLASGGVQDVDFVQPAPIGHVPVENITFPDLSKMPEGEYRCYVHNWKFRSPTEGGFKAEIEFDGQIFEYEHDRPLKGGEWVEVATVTLRGGEFSIRHALPHATASQDLWGIKTQGFVRVETLLTSPNHWGDQAVGNKHWFFILEGCKNPEPCRGIYNEFLKGELDKHRKVFEVLGSKTMVAPADEQLSGVGFSTTKRDSVIVRVTTSTNTQLFKITF